MSAIGAKIFFAITYGTLALFVLPGIPGAASFLMDISDDYGTPTTFYWIDSALTWYLHHDQYIVDAAPLIAIAITAAYMILIGIMSRNKGVN